MSNNSATRKLSAIFASPDDPNSKPRKRYTKEDLLSRFKSTKELDKTVFVQEVMLDYADLFVSNGDKP